VHDFQYEPVDFCENKFPVKDFAKTTPLFAAIHQKTSNLDEKASNFPKINKHKKL
jgi:hypothetical protein